MRNVTISIEPEIFRLVPDYRRTVVFAEANTASSTALPLLAEALAAAGSRRYTAARAGAVTGAQDVPSVQRWRQAFRAVGLDPTRNRPAVEALLRRAMKGEPLALGNTMIDIGTTVCLEFGVPVGVHVLDELEGSLSLTRALGNEKFVTFSGEEEPPEPGEIVYKCGNEILTRRWVWRQGRVGSVTPSSSMFAINIDALGDDDEQAATERLQQLLGRAGAEIQGVVILDRTSAGDSLAGGLPEHADVSPPLTISEAPNPDAAIEPAAKDLLHELAARGVLAACTDESGLRHELAQGPIVLYCGIDPTAPSLHVGSLMIFATLRRFQLAGHTPIVVLGGATGFIGDPSGRSSERVLLDHATLDANKAAIRGQIERLLPTLAKTPAPVLVDNRDWTANVNILEFLRDVGTRVRVGEMLTRDSARVRLESDLGLSLAEFCYPVLQAHDFEVLHRTRHCSLQLGGTDQWSNIISGIDLIRRVHGNQAYGLVWPLLTRSDGSKFGKTADGTVWLDPDLTSPWQLWQYWLSVSDDEIGPLLRLLSLQTLQELESLLTLHHSDPGKRVAQRSLGDEIVASVHGDEVLGPIHRAASILFDDGEMALDDQAVIDILRHQLPTTVISRNDVPSLDLCALAVLTGAAVGRSAARRLVAQGGLYVNGYRQQDPETNAGELLEGDVALLRRGKKDYRLVIVEPDLTKRFNEEKAAAIILGTVSIAGVKRSFGEISSSEARLKSEHMNRAAKLDVTHPNRWTMAGLRLSAEWARLADTLDAVAAERVSDLGTDVRDWTHLLGGSEIDAAPPGKRTLPITPVSRQAAAAGFVAHGLGSP